MAESAQPAATAAATPEADATQPAQQATTPKFAGKYDTVEALSEGIKSLAKQIDYPLPEDKPLIGDGGAFSNVQTAERAYKAMQRAFTRGQQAQQGQQQQAQGAQPKDDAKPTDHLGDGLQIPEPKPEPPPAADDDATVEQVLAKAGLKAEDLAAEWQKSGKLTDAQYAALKAQGYPKAMVDRQMHLEAKEYAASIQQQQAIVTEATKLVGGDTQLQNLLAWGKNLPAAEQADLNRRLGDPKLWKGAIQQLKAAHAAAVGAGGSNPLVNTGNTTATAGVITDRAEYIRISRLARRGDADALRRYKAHHAGGGKRFF